MAIYNEKDSVNTVKMKNRRWLHLIYGIRVSYFLKKNPNIFAAVASHTE